MPSLLCDSSSFVLFPHSLHSTAPIMISICPFPHDFTSLSNFETLFKFDPVQIKQWITCLFLQQRCKTKVSSTTSTSTLSRMPHLLSFLLTILFHCLWYYLTCRWYQDRDLLITIFDIFRMIRHHVTFFTFPTDESFEEKVFVLETTAGTTAITTGLRRHLRRHSATRFPNQGFVGGCWTCSSSFTAANLPAISRQVPDLKR